MTSDLKYINKSLEKSFKIHRRRYNDQGYFVVIGHPKTFTPYSLEKLYSFVERHNEVHEFTTYRQQRDLGLIE